MKKKLLLCLVPLLLIVLVGCGDVSEVKIEDFPPSEEFTTPELAQGCREITAYFRREFRGCKLLSIRYAGDEALEEEWAKSHNVDKVMVFYSDFYVGEHAEPSLNPNSTYTDWTWILVQNEHGQWKHADHGY